MLDIDTIPYAYFMEPDDAPRTAWIRPECTGGKHVVVPFRIDRRVIESSLNCVRTGMLHGAELSPSLAVLAPFYVQNMSDDAEAVGAGNVVYLDGAGTVCASNTHVDAFRGAMLRSIVGSGVGSPSALVFGTGYAARVAVWVLCRLCGSVTIVSRNPDMHNAGLHAIERMLARLPGGAEIGTVGYGETAVADYDIVVNATPMGAGMNRCSPLGQCGADTGKCARPGQIWCEFPIGRHRSAFLPGDGITGMELAAEASAMAYATMCGFGMPERISLSAKFNGLALRAYAALPAASEDYQQLT